MTQDAFQAALRETQHATDGDLERFFTRARDDPDRFLGVADSLDAPRPLDRDGDYLDDWFDEMLAGLEEYVMRGGKRFRPFVVELAYDAVGGELDREELAPLPLSVELYHNATLVHDDMMDQDRMRRADDTWTAEDEEPPEARTWHTRKREELAETLSGRAADSYLAETVDGLSRPEMVAVSDAIIAGNVLEEFAKKAVFDSVLVPGIADEQRLADYLRQDAILEELTDMDVLVNSGQAGDLHLELLSLQDIAHHELGYDGGAPGEAASALYHHYSDAYDSWTDAYLNMSDRKTGDLFQSAARIGAVAGGGTDEQEQALVDAMRRIGRAFQIQDDYLELEDSDAGKEPTDLFNGKLTLASLSAYETMTAAHDILDTDEAVVDRDALAQAYGQATGRDHGEAAARVSYGLQQGGSYLEDILDHVDLDAYAPDHDLSVSQERLPELLQRSRERVAADRRFLLDHYGRVSRGDPELDELRGTILEYAAAKEQATEEIYAARTILQDAPLEQGAVDTFEGLAAYMLARDH